MSVVVYVVGLLDTQSTLSGSRIVFGCSVHYPPFDLKVDTFIFQLPNKLRQFGTLFSIIWIVHACPVSSILALKGLRSGSYVVSTLPSSVITSAWYITFFFPQSPSKGHSYCVQTQGSTSSSVSELRTVKLCLPILFFILGMQL